MPTAVSPGITLDDVQDKTVAAVVAAAVVVAARAVAYEALEELETLAPNYVVTDYYRMVLARDSKEDVVIAAAQAIMEKVAEEDTLWWSAKLHYEYAKNKSLSNISDDVENYLGKNKDDFILISYVMLTNALKDPISDQTEIHENIRVVLDAGIENLYEPEMKNLF